MPLVVGNPTGDRLDSELEAYAVAEIFAYVAKLGDMQRDVVYTAVRDAYRAHGFGIGPNDRTQEPTYPTLSEVLGRIEREEGKKFRYGRKKVLITSRDLIEFLASLRTQPRTR